MKNRFLRLPTATAHGLLLLMTYMQPATSSDNPHIISKADDTATCAICHIEPPKIVGDQLFTSKNLAIDLANFKLDGIGMCTTCHASGQNHMVGKTIDFPIPLDMPLGPDQDVMCVTCHYTHGRLDSDAPQASFSFMDRLLNAERLRKSFLLRRNNTNGELCLTCHDANQGSK